MTVREDARWIQRILSGLLAAILGACGGDVALLPAAQGSNPIMGDLVKPQYACFRNPADPRRSACCTGSGCSHVANPSLPKLRAAVMRGP
jgi:hypothetical protein